MKYKVINIKINNIKKFFFLLKNYNKKHLFLKNYSFFKWQYLYKNRYNGFILKYKNLYLSFQLFIPLNKFDKKLSDRNIFLTNFYSNGSKLGTGLLVFRELIKKLKPIFIGSTGIWSKRLIFYHKKLGFEVGKMNHFILQSTLISKFKIAIINKKSIKKSIKKKMKYKNINKKYFLIKNKKNYNFDPKIFKEYYPYKSYKYMQNRYLEHPIFTYKIYSIINKKLTSGIVVRVINYKSSKFIKLIEFFGSNKEFINYKDLFHYLLLKYKAEYISFYNYGMDVKDVKKCGFFLNQNKKGIYPELIKPMIKENVELSYAFKTEIKKNVKIFLGDGDRDRPN
jgi:hypothetical protein